MAKRNQTSLSKDKGLDGWSRLQNVSVEMRMESKIEIMAASL